MSHESKRAGDVSVEHLAREMEATCLNMRSRLVSRVITRLYDTELRPLGLTASQLNLLCAVAAGGPVRRSDLGRYLQIDASTLTRNLRIMLESGWLAEVRDRADGRGAPLRISPKGERLLRRASKPWRIAQRRAAELMGTAAVATLTNLSAELHA